MDSVRILPRFQPRKQAVGLEITPDVTRDIGFPLPCFLRSRFAQLNTFRSHVVNNRELFKPVSFAVFRVRHLSPRTSALLRPTTRIRTPSICRNKPQGSAPHLTGSYLKDLCASVLDHVL